MKIPTELEGIVDMKKFKRMQKYNKAKQEIDAIQTYLSTILDIVLLYFGAVTWMWYRSQFLVGTLGLDTHNEVLYIYIYIEIYCNSISND